MKKFDKKIYAIVLLGVIFTLGIFLTWNDAKEKLEEKISPTKETDEIKFKKEYESLNGKEKDNNNGNHMEINITKNNKMKYSSEKEILSLLENGTGIIYFGFPKCPWCRNLVPVLTEAAENENLDKIYYLNNLDSRDIKKLDNGKIITEQEGTKNYFKIVDKLKEHLGEYEGLEDDSIKRLYFPTVVFVKEGKIIYVHIGTLDNHEDGNKELTKKQKKELNETLTKYMIETYSETCEKEKTGC
jgi:hypothetical protein